MAITTPVLKNSDYRKLRETLGCSIVELMYLVGSQRSPIYPPDAPVTSLPRRYLLRLLLDQPNLADSLFPPLPNFSSIYAHLESFWPEQYAPISIRKTAILFGVIPATVYSWRKGKEPTLAVSKLFFFLDALLKQYGKEGLRLYLEIIETDLIANGISGGLEEAFKKPEATCKFLNPKGLLSI